MFFTQALATGAVPVEVTTDRAPAYPRILDRLTSSTQVPSTIPSNMRTTQSKPTMVGFDARLRPMRGLITFRSTPILATGHAFIPNLTRSHYDIATDTPAQHRLPAGFDELALPIASHDGTVLV